MSDKDFGSNRQGDLPTGQADTSVVGPYRARQTHDRWFVGRELPCINGLSAWASVCSTVDPSAEEYGYTDGACGTAEENAHLIVGALNGAPQWTAWAARAKETDAAIVAAALAPFVHVLAAGKLPAGRTTVHLTSLDGQWLATLDTEDFWNARHALGRLKATTAAEADSVGTDERSEEVNQNTQVIP